MRSAEMVVSGRKLPILLNNSQFIAGSLMLIAFSIDKPVKTSNLRELSKKLHLRGVWILSLFRRTKVPVMLMKFATTKKATIAIPFGSFLRHHQLTYG